jgi:DNA-binding MarR family transcriptional regulator
MTEPRYNANFHLIRVLLRFFKGFMSRINKHIRDHGLTETQFVVLEMLYSKGTLTINDIVERSLSTDGNIGVVINNLEKQGLVEKRVDRRDKRIRRVSLTAKGQDVIGTYFPKHEAFVNELFSNVPRKDLEELIFMMKSVGKRL